VGIPKRTIEVRSFFTRHSHSATFYLIAITLLALGCLGFGLGFQSLNDVRGFVLRDAAERGDLARVKWLLKDHPDLVSNRSNLAWTPLYLAVVYDHKDVAEVLLANGADVNDKTDGGDSLLETTVNLGDREMVEFLLDHGADVNSRDNHGGTPLNEAKANVVELLLAHGANLEARDDAEGGGGDTPLVGADRAKAELLLAHGADVNAKDKAGLAPLHFAAQGEQDVAALLLEHDANVEAKDGEGDTPLHLAAMMGYVNEAKLLLANKADVNARDNKGFTPWSYATENGHKDLADMLRQHGGHK
jgi:ankyrin repeat protein